MQVVFLGVGEACDERYPNTALWLRGGPAQEQTSVLLDCGFTVPPRYWALDRDPDELDLLWISHFHGDHFFGTPALLLRFREMKRSKPLVVMGQEGVEEKVAEALELAYAGLSGKLTYPVRFVTVRAGETVDAAGFRFRFALSGHPRSNCAVRVEDGSGALFYSGDGPPTEETLEIATGCGLVVHEAFRFEGTVPGHGTVRGSIDFAGKAGAETLALVHLDREERRLRGREISDLIATLRRPRVILPEPGDSRTV